MNQKTKKRLERLVNVAELMADEFSFIAADYGDVILKDKLRKWDRIIAIAKKEIETS